MIFKITEVITISNPSYEVVKWADDNLVFNNPEYQKKKAMGLWLGDTPEKLVLYERNGTDLIVPYGAGGYLMPYIHNKPVVIANNLTPEKPVHIKGLIPLYDYQEEAVPKLVKGRNGLLVSPAGSGKTQIGIALIQRLGLKALWVTHTIDLLKQSKSRAETYLKGDFGTIMGGEVNIGADITFATVQTMVNLDLNKYKNEWNVIVVDEAHRVTGSPTNVMQFYKVLNNLNARHKYGLTATYKTKGVKDFKRTAEFILGAVIHEIPESAVADKIIKSRKNIVDLDTPFALDYLNPDGTMNFNNLMTYLTENEERNNQIVQDLKDNAGQFNLILSHRVAHLHLLRDMLGEGVVVVGSVKGKDRDKYIQDAREGKINYLFSTFHLAKEGLDIPILNRLYLTTPIKDYISTIQSVGRIERNIEGKKQPVVYDYVDVNIPHLKGFARARQRHYNKK